MPACLPSERRYTGSLKISLLLWNGVLWSQQIVVKTWHNWAVGYECFFITNELAQEKVHDHLLLHGTCRSLPHWSSFFYFICTERGNACIVSHIIAKPLGCHILLQHKLFWTWFTFPLWSLNTQSDLLSTSWGHHLINYGLLTLTQTADYRLLTPTTFCWTTAFSAFPHQAAQQPISNYWYTILFSSS